MATPTTRPACKPPAPVNDGRPAAPAAPVPSAAPALPGELRRCALHLLLLPSPHDKAHTLTQQTGLDLPLDTDPSLAEPPGLPGRPQRPVLVPPQALSQRSVGTPLGHAALIHALAHIEANAIHLALDIVWRFAGLPPAFYRDWWQVAVEEAGHFLLLQQHLLSLGHAYGDFPAHDGLWDMARATRGDVLARLALVPRLLEARGLDATPPIRAKLVSVGDLAGARVLDIILRDEIGHVATGNRWFHHLCQQRQMDPLHTFQDLLQRHRAPAFKGACNLSARRQAGFTDSELAALCPGQSCA